MNKVFHLDANRSQLDQYALGWDAYLQQRETDEKRRRRERANAEKKASTLMAQADKMRAKATKTVAAQNMARRAERLLSGLEDVRASDKVARLRFPEPAACGKTPLTAADLSKTYGSQEVFTGVDLAIDRGSKVVVLGLNGAGKTTLLRILGGVEKSDTGEVRPGHGLKLGYYAQEHETLDLDRTVVENLKSAAPDLTETQVRGPSSGRSCSRATTPTSRPRSCPAGRRPGSRSRPSSSRRPTSCSSTSRRTTSTPRPARRSSPRCAGTPARSSSSRTTRAPSRPSTPSASCCCRTATRTCGTPATWT